MTNEQKEIVRKYKTFDNYLASEEFEKLLPEEQISLYREFQKAGRIEGPLSRGRRRINLTGNLSFDEEPREDREILQPDGSRACINWELDPAGFQIFNN